MRQSMRNLQLQIVCWTILMYSNARKSFWTYLTFYYERACMSNPKEQYYMKMFETLVSYNDLNNRPVSNKKIQQAVSIVMEETGEK